VLTVGGPTWRRSVTATAATHRAPACCAAVGGGRQRLLARLGDRHGRDLILGGGRIVHDADSSSPAPPNRLSEELLSTLNDFGFAAQPGVDEKLFHDLATLRFLGNASNFLLVGPPGVGKMMRAVALDRAAVDVGHRVYFTVAAELAGKCHKAALEGSWSTIMRLFAGRRLLVIDELGRLP